MRWKLPFGLVAALAGSFFVYAAWASPPFYPATSCAVEPDPSVHFSGWALDYYNSCGGAYEHQLLYLLEFTLLGVTLVGGAAGSIREALAD